MAELHNERLESELIGAMLNNPALIAEAATKLTPDMMHNEFARIAYDAMLEMANKGDAIDPFTVADECIKRKASDQWIEWLATIAAHSYLGGNFDAYVKRVADHATVRKVHAAAIEVTRICHDPDSDPDEIIAKAQQAVLSLVTLEGPGGPRQAVEAARTWWAGVEAAAESGNGIMGVRFGFDGLDQRIGGMRQSELIVLAARPSKGKTVMALNGSAAAFGRNQNVLFFSLEMSGDELMGRIASAETWIPYSELQRGYLTDSQRIANNEFIARIKGLSLWIDDKADLSIAEIRSRARSLAAKRKLDLIVVDYLQLVTGVGENENVKVNSVSRGLKQMAKELKCPVLALSQLNREVDKRPTGEPHLSDLRGSGGIEQDADIIIFLWEPTEGKTIAKTAKHRRGQKGDNHFDQRFDVMRFVEGYQWIPSKNEDANKNKSYSRGMD